MDGSSAGADFCLWRGGTSVRAAGVRYDPTMQPSLLGGLFALSLLTSLPAQTVCVTGILEAVPGPTICQQGETHWLPAANVYLRASGINLGNYVGRTVVVHGVDIGLVCRVLDVRQVDDPARVQLIHCGSQMIGCPFKVKVNGPGLGFAVLGASLARGFTPFSCSGLGPVETTLLLGSPITTLVAGATGTGSLEQVVPIPLVSAFVGVLVLFQGAHMTIGPIGPLYFSNVVELVPGPLLPPCAPTNC